MAKAKAKAQRKGDEVYLDLTFNVMGHVKQTIKLADPNTDPDRLVADLEAGKVFTTIQEGGNVEVVESGKVVGTVTSVDNECEYDEFEADGGKYRLVPHKDIEGTFHREPLDHEERKRWTAKPGVDDEDDAEKF